MKKKHERQSLKTVILICLLLQTVVFFGGCKNEVNTVVNSDKAIHLSHSNAAEVKNKFCYLSGEELQELDKDSIKKTIDNQNILLVTDLNSPDMLRKVSSQVGGVLNDEKLADLQRPKGLVIYQNENGKIETFPVIGHCLLSEFKEEKGAAKDEKGQDVFISKVKNSGKIGETWKNIELDPEVLYSVAQALKKDEAKGAQSRIFVYFGYDGNRTKELGTAIITISAEELKVQNGHRYDKVNSHIKVYGAADSELSSFNLKHGVRSDDSAVILNSKILSKVQNTQILTEGGLTYSDIWAVTEIEENCVNMKAESVLKYKDGQNGSGFRCGINYLVIRYGALDYKSPTDQVVSLSK